MQFPDVTVEVIVNHGIHLDPRTHDLLPAEVKGALSTCYELMLFPEDWDGGPVIDGVHCPAAKDHIVCCKPTQYKRLKGAFKSYSLKLNTTDPQLKEALDNLPTYTYHPNAAEILTKIRSAYYTVATRTSLVDRLELTSLTSTILHMLLSAEFPLEHTHQGNPRRHQQALLAANQYLKEHLEEDLDLAKLAKDSHLHPTYFHKLFTAAFGMSPSEQLMLYRIRKSRDLLRQDDLTIAEIARQCGFSSQSYFTRKYKEINKETPSKFRNAIRKRRRK